jgi:hypothetical protein
MNQAASNVVRRFLARNFLADDRFRPPKSVVNAVETGKLDSHVLLFWKDVVEKISATPQGWKGSASYSAAVAYWRSKCAKNGYPLPREYMEGLGGKGSQGRWSVKAGDEIEEWVKQTMHSQGLIGTLVKTAAEVEMEVSHTKRLLDDAQARVEKHVAGLGTAKTQKGVAQKQKWLDEAMTEVGNFEAQLEKSIEQVKALKNAAVKKDETENYSIEFEKEFQFRLTVAAKTLDKKSVIDAVHKAIERFEKGLEVPGPYTGPEDEPTWEAKTAGITDYISGFLIKAWNYLKGAFDLFTDWMMGLKDDTKSIEALLKEAGASD